MTHGAHRPSAGPGRISVAMATYGGAAHLEEQLESITRQRVLPGELVICDDGSRDATLEIAGAFAARAPFPVHVHANPSRLGFADNFLHAAELCRGELIAFCDQDDVWREDKLERCEATFRERPGLRLLVHSSTLVDERLAPLARRYPEVGPSRIESCLVADRTFHAMGACMVVAAPLLRLIDGDRRPRSVYADAELMNHDQLIHFLAVATGEVAYVDEALILYRQHGRNTVGARNTSVRGRVRTAMGLQTADYDAAAEHYDDCAACLEELAARTPELGHRLLAGAEAHRRLAWAYRRRRLLLEPDRTVAARLAVLAELVRARGYRERRRGGLGPRALAKDAAAVALPARRLRTG